MRRRPRASKSIAARTSTGAKLKGSKDPLANFARFNEIMQRQRLDADQRRLAAIKKQWEEFGEIRDRDLLFRIGFSSPEFAKELVAIHPGKRLTDRVNNVGRAFDILSQSRASFVDLAGRYHFRVVHQLYKTDDRELALSEATKEVYTYSCAASSLVQAYRHMVSENNEFKRRYDELRTEVFKDAKFLRFFSDLRNSNNHIHILTASPHHTITSRFEGKPDVESGISFDREMILNGDWSNESKSFVKDRASLEVIDLMDEHFELASRFNKIVLFRTGIHADRTYRDLARIQHARDVIGKRVWLSILLQQAVPQKLNPYEYLRGWFSEAELKNIYSFADHTKEQLEYMISLRDPFGFCDAHTRKKLYKLFSVPLDLLPDQPPDKPRIDI